MRSEAADLTQEVKLLELKAECSSFLKLSESTPCGRYYRRYLAKIPELQQLLRTSLLSWKRSSGTTLISLAASVSSAACASVGYLRSSSGPLENIILALVSFPLINFLNS